MPVVVQCNWCGQHIEVADKPSTATVVCPQCHTICGVPATAQRRPTAKPAKQPPPAAPEPKPAAPKLPLPSRQPTVADDDEDSGPYGVAQAQPTCPKCAAPWPAETKVCPACGYEEPAPDADRPLPPLERQWDAGLSYKTRKWIYIAYEIPFLVLIILLGLTNLGSLVEVGLSALGISALGAFVLGTFARVDLKRNQRGRITLVQTWFFCFYTWNTTKIGLKDYDTIATVAYHENNSFDWFILLWLLSLAFVPGVLWWFFVFSKPTYQVTLAQGYGSESLILYRGRSEEHMKDMAQTVSEVCHFPMQ